jgi:hypothetical protein
VDLRDEHLPRGEAKLATALAHVITHRRLRHVSAMLVNEPPPDPVRGMPCLRGATTSAVSHSSINSRYAPSFGAGRPSGRRLVGGSDDASAPRTDALHGAARAPESTALRDLCLV